MLSIEMAERGYSIEMEKCTIPKIMECHKSRESECTLLDILRTMYQRTLPIKRSTAVERVGNLRKLNSRRKS